MSRLFQPGTSVGTQFGNATQLEQTYGCAIGYEAANYPPKTSYITVGRHGEEDLPPGATSKPPSVAAPYISKAYNWDKK